MTDGWEIEAKTIEDYSFTFGYFSSFRLGGTWQEFAFLSQEAGGNYPSLESRGSEITRK